jgi:hypothetical protein
MVSIKHALIVFDMLKSSTVVSILSFSPYTVSHITGLYISYNCYLPGLLVFLFPTGIAMLAVLGHIHTAFGARVPGNIDYSGTSFASIKTGIAGLKDIPSAGLLQIVAFIGFLEIFVMKDKGSGEFPGDLRNGMFTWKGTDEALMQKRAIELNNGRAAQMGILGLMVHEMLDGEPYVINALFGNPSNFNAGL